MSKITLNTVGDLTNFITAETVINNNSAAIEIASDNTLSRDGTTPNMMLSNLDMNSFQILNLPNPATTNSPLRLQDLNSFIGGGTIATIPAGGTTGQVLSKTSGVDYATAWTHENTRLTAGLNIALTGTTPVTIATISNPIFSTSVTTPLLINTGTLTLPTSTDTLVGKATTDIFTNKTFDTAGSGNVFKVAGNTISSVTGTGAGVVLSTTPTIAGITLSGTLSGGGNQVNNVIIGTVTPLAGSFTSLTSTTGLNVTNNSNALLQAFIATNTDAGASAAVSNSFAVTNNGTFGLSAGSTAFGGFAIVAWSGTGGLFFDNNNASGSITFRTSTGPQVNALVISNTQSVLSPSPTGGLGYGTGAGGSVTQITSRATGVILNKICGAITLIAAVNAATSAATAQTITVTNSTVAVTDTILINQKSGTDKYMIFVTNVAAGSFQITWFTTGGTTNESPVFAYSVHKAVIT